MMALTHDRLLGGRILYSQPRTGFRSGIEPILLAAAIPACAGDRLLEAGAASGAALLCVAARVPSVTGTGIELDPALCRIASGNAKDNGFSNLKFIAGDVCETVPTEAFDHAFANPPFHPQGTRSPDRARETAKRSTSGLLEAWALALARPLRPRGTLTFVLPAAMLPLCLWALEAAKCGGISVMPLWPKADRAAKLVIVQSTKSSRAPVRLLPGLILHKYSGEFTEAADAILRDGEPMPLA